MSNFLSLYIPVAEAISQLFQPCVEVVIHELQTDRVFFVTSSQSGVKAGDASLLSLSNNDLKNEGNIIGPYEKTGHKGQSVSSITVVLRDSQNIAQGLMCINADYSQYDQALNLIESLVRPRQPQSHPEILFRNDWKSLIKDEISTFLNSNQLDLISLNQKNRRTLMSYLNSKNLFYAKKSIEQVANILGVSRATSYNDLQAIKKRKK